MLKNLSRLEHKIGERAYHLFCDMDSPVGEVKEALCQFLSYLTQVEKAAAEQAKVKEEKPAEAVSPAAVE